MSRIFSSSSMYSQVWCSNYVFLYIASSNDHRQFGPAGLVPLGRKLFESAGRNSHLSTALHTNLAFTSRLACLTMKPAQLFLSFAAFLAACTANPTPLVPARGNSIGRRASTYAGSVTFTTNRQFLACCISNSARRSDLTVVHFNN